MFTLSILTFIVISTFLNGFPYVVQDKKTKKDKKPPPKKDDDNVSTMFQIEK